jgi:hypothetical protein
VVVVVVVVEVGCALAPTKASVVGRAIRGRRLRTGRMSGCAVSGLLRAAVGGHARGATVMRARLPWRCYWRAALRRFVPPARTWRGRREGRGAE